MTSVVITRNPSADYVYNTATFQWDSIEGDEPWTTSSLDAWDIAIGEDLIFAEGREMPFIKGIAETLTYVETVAKDMVMPTFAETIAFMEGTDIEIPFNLSFNENMTFVELIAKDMVNQLADSFSFSDVATKDIGIAASESWTTAEVFDRDIDYNMAFPETLNFLEAIGKQPHINEAETLSIIDEYIRRANGVLSDLLIDVGDISTTEFTALLRDGRPAGATSFIKYVPGDYLYQNAVYRAKMFSLNTIDKGRINELKLEVDVPDLIETGQSVISVAGTGVAVVFTKTFHITPDINVVFKGGTGDTTDVAFYEDETKTGFTAYLEDSGGTKQTGTVSWAVRGY